MLTAAHVFNSANNIVQSTNNCTKHNCYSKRRCYRFRDCVKCQRLKRTYLLMQSKFFIDHWGMNKFVTVAALSEKLKDLADAFDLGMRMRKQLRRHLFLKHKYFCVLSVSESSEVTNRSTQLIPHLHMIIDGKIEKAKLRKYLSKHFKEVHISVYVQKIESNASCARTANYIYKNYLSTLKLNSFKIRLLTASRGFLTGNPKFLPYLKGLKLWI